MKLNVAYIFPGQGTQYVGMGKDFYQSLPQARRIFDSANKILGFDLAGLVFKGPLDELTKTANCQVAVFTTSIASLEAMKSKHLRMNVKYTAGLSLGEYSALVAAEAIDFERALELVRIRGKCMEEASQKNPGGMISVIGLSLENVEEISKETGVEIANLNSPGQIVVSGNFSGLKKAEEQALSLGAKKVIPLKVGGAFHSSLMAQAGEKLAVALENVEIRSPKIPLVSNVTGEATVSPPKIKENLVRQITSPTLWEESINLIASSGIKDYIEIGPGKVLKGLLRKINPELKVYNIGTFEELEDFREEKVSCC